MKTFAIIFITFLDFLMFYKIFLSPQVKRIMIISNKHGIYELLKNLKKSRNQEKSVKSQNLLEI